MKVDAQMTIQELCHRLAQKGYALSTLGSITGQTVAGAISTATHGSGHDVGSLSSLVHGLEVVPPEQQKIELSEGDEQFPAFTCSLGTLGIIVSVTLKVEPLYALACCYRVHPHESLSSFFPAMERSDFYKLWYLPHSDEFVEFRGAKCPVPPKFGCGEPPRVSPFYRRLYETALAATLRLPRLNHHLENLHSTYFHPLKRKLGPQEKQPYVTSLALDCLYSQQVTEFAFRRSEAVEFFSKLRILLRSGRYLVHQPIEIRFGAAESSWLSPAQGRETCWIGVVRYRPFQIEPPADLFFDALRELAFSFEGREHWAKMPVGSEPNLGATYPKLSRFLMAKRLYDPRDLLGIPWITRYIQEVC